MKTVILDFETYYDDKYNIKRMTNIEYVDSEKFHVHGVGIKDNSGANWYSEGDVQDKINSLPWDKIEMVCHNVFFDGTILNRVFNVRPATYRDTLCMARGMYPHYENSLEAISKRLDLGIKGKTLDSIKGVKHLSNSQDIELANYCFQDLYLTEKLYNLLKVNYPESELELINLTLKMFLEPKMIMDINKLQNIIEEEQKETEDLIKKTGISRKTFASKNKYVELLIGLGIDIPSKISPRTGKSIAAMAKDDEGFKDLYFKYPEHKNIWDARLRVSSRINETRADRLIKLQRKEGDAVGIPLTYYGAHTGRFSGAEKINFQNLSPKLRKVVEAPSGYTFYNGDLKQIEVRVLATMANAQTLIHSFKAERDIYTEFASEHLYYRPVAKDSQERFLGKRAILGLGYQMGATTFSSALRQTGISLDYGDCLRIVDTYRATYPEIPSLWYTVQNMIPSMCDTTNTGVKINMNGIVLTFGYQYITLPNGMRLTYPGLKLTETGDFHYQSRKKGNEISLYGGKLTENIIQALARIIITDMMRHLDKFLLPLHGWVTGMVHDNIWSIAPEELDISNQVIDIMTTVPDWILNVPLSVDLKINEA